MFDERRMAIMATGHDIMMATSQVRQLQVTVHTPLSREVFPRVFAEIPRVAAPKCCFTTFCVHRAACYWARSEQ